MDRARVVYVTYDGLCDHIAQSQVLPYTLGAARGGWPMTIISHEKPTRTGAEIARVADLLAEESVDWIRLPYLASRPTQALPFHLAAEIGALVRRIGRQRRVILHARSYIPAVATAAVGAALGIPWIFDIRGFWFDEKVDAGRTAGRAYRIAKRAERELLRRADAIVSLTDAARVPMQEWVGTLEFAGKISVIPTCVDLARFTPPATPQHDWPLRIGYVGSFGPRYLLDEMVRVFAAIKRQRSDAHFRVVTRSEVSSLHEACGRAGLAPEAYSTVSVDHVGVVDELRAMHATLSLVEPGRASAASCPTKFGESLATGCPVVVNPGVGDCADIVRCHGIGVVHDAGRDPAMTASELLRLLSDPAHAGRCRAVAVERFSVDWAIDRYDEIYARLATR